MYKSIITWVLYLYILCFWALMFNEIMFTQNGFKHKMKAMQINYDSSSDIISWCSSSCDVYTDDNVSVVSFGSKCGLSEIEFAKKRTYKCSMQRQSE